MALKLYLFGLYSTLTLSFFLCLLLILEANPYQAPTWILTVFYLTIFLIVTSALSLINYYLKIWASNREVIFSQLAPAVRQASLIGVIVVSCLFFKQINVLNWWIFTMLVIAIGLLELFFRSKKVKIGKLI